MPSRSHRPERRRPRVAAPLPVAVLSVLAGLVAVAPAGAHSILVSTTPGPGTELEALTEVRLDFAGDVSPDGHVVAVHSSTGELTAASYEVPQAHSVVARFDAPIPAGMHEIVWEVVAADGHRERGRIPVTVTEPAPTTAPPTAAPATEAPPTTVAAEPATSDPGGEPGDKDPATGTDAEVAGDGGSDGDEGGPPTAVVVGVAVVAVVAAGAAAAYRSRKARAAS